MSTKSDSGSEGTPAVSCGGSSNVSASSHDRHSTMDTLDDDVCRDYMRNVCTRGKRCRYKHPPGGAADDRSDQQQGPPRRDLTFCHDYQNNGCTRASCKFLHCSRDEQEYFYRTGLLPSRLNQSGSGASSMSLRAEVPVCRDYLNGDCKRGGKCKYRHETDKPSGMYGGGSRHDYDRRSSSDYGPSSESKRRRMDDDGDGDVNGGRGSYSALEDENASLRRKVAELKKQVTDLTAINEVLLEQNARYRMGKVAAAAAAAAAGMGVQVTAAATQQGIMHTAVALAPPPAAAAAHSSLTHQLNSSLTQQVALNSDLATQHAMAAQRLAAAQGGSLVQPRVAPPAMSVTPAVTIAPQNVAGPLALTQSNLPVSMASMPQLQVAHSLTQNLGAPSTSLVSYPIMSQNMRSVVEHSNHAH